MAPELSGESDTAGGLELSAPFAADGPLAVWGGVRTHVRNAICGFRACACGANFAGIGWRGLSTIELTGPSNGIVNR